MPITPPPAYQGNHKSVGRSLIDLVAFIYAVLVGVSQLFLWAFLAAVGCLIGRRFYVGWDANDKTLYEWQPYSYRMKLNDGTRFGLVEAVSSRQDFHEKCCRRTPASYIVLVLWATWAGVGALGQASFIAWALIGALAIAGLTYVVFSNIGTEKRLKALELHPAQVPQRARGLPNV